MTVNSAWNIITFRAGLVRALVAKGYEVVLAAPADSHVSRLTSLNCRYIDLPMDNQGTHVLRDLALLYRYWRTFRAERPAIVLSFTIKPNVYGSIAAHALGIPVINNIAGLGTAFMRKGWLNSVARSLYRVALSRSKRIFFQNREDLTEFLSLGLARPDQVARLPGSGVDTFYFAPSPLVTAQPRPFRFVLMARMIWEKGVGEYVEAARKLRANGVSMDALLLGFLDVKNPSAIPRDQMRQWVNEGVVKYLGETEDVRGILAEIDCVVLPSYREGTPKSLLEAASMGKPVITTDVPGCRDVVEHGSSGYLVPPKDVEALVDAMGRMSKLPRVEIERMGERARAIAVERFDERLVIAAYEHAVADYVESLNS